MPKRVHRLAGSEGAYVGVDGQVRRQVGTWQLKCEIEILEVPSFDAGRERLQGMLGLELLAARRDSDQFVGKLRLRGGGEVEVRLTLLEGSMTVNQLDPSSALDALKASIGYS